MGMFSWFTSDTEQQIVVDNTRNIIMTGKDGQIFEQRDAYEGYGVFGGKDFYEYLAELNEITPTREAGISLAFDIGGRDGDLETLEKKGFYAPRLFAEESNARSWDRFGPPANDPNQGFDMEEDEEEDEYYDDDDDDYYESVIEVKEDVKVGDLILESGDKIRVLKKEALGGRYNQFYSHSKAVQACMDYLDENGLDELPDTSETIDEALDELVEMFAVSGSDRDDILTNSGLRTYLEDSGRFQD